jgi:hypothetical protein
VLSHRPDSSRLLSRSLDDGSEVVAPHQEQLPEQACEWPVAVLVQNLDPKKAMFRTHESLTFQTRKVCQTE